MGTKKDLGRYDNRKCRSYVLVDPKSPDGRETYLNAVEPLSRNMKDEEDMVN
ncbi:hypothetical protein [Nitrososphaera sp. AFS]|uniref:hypothetical protein n=1 Tax=Nitrososphaera sp. AFS TaxID=2301191 RepID=UPI00139221AF|nr:hypothetical protein [Nitrososphaera sp. AFS]